MIILRAIFFLLIVVISLVYPSEAQRKPTVCILGGTPSTAEIVKEIPESLKAKYNFISFNRPGFGGTENDSLAYEKLYKLAEEAGLKKKDFGIIGISGGAPLAMLIAAKFHLKHCGIISGMVPKEAFFKHADSAVTRDLMKGVLSGFPHFESAALKFPNIDFIVKQAGSPSTSVAIRACYDDLNFILNSNVNAIIHNQGMEIDWYHGGKDVNVPLKSVQHFLRDYPQAKLNTLPGATHGIDSRIYITKLIESWGNTK